MCRLCAGCAFAGGPGSLVPWSFAYCGITRQELGSKHLVAACAIAPFRCLAHLPEPTLLARPLVTYVWGHWHAVPLLARKWLTQLFVLVHSGLRIRPRNQA